MEALLLGAAARVLLEEGPAGFNTNRVAERAGVSVGSLYQYYPNKAALLFRLHELESADTSAAIARILDDVSRTPRWRFFAAVRAFFETEAVETPLREALALSRVHFRESPEFAEIERRVVERIRRFLRAARPAAARRGDFDARFVATVLGAVSEAITSRGARGRELRRWADACSEMLCAHLGLGADPPPRPPSEQPPSAPSDGGLPEPGPATGVGWGLHASAARRAEAHPTVQARPPSTTRA
jgi:AcrR family transcriptional regulator